MKGREDGVFHCLALIKSDTATLVIFFVRGLVGFNVVRESSKRT